MATPTSLPASFSTGAVLTAAQMNDLRGAFRILQVAATTHSTTATSTTTTFADTGLTLSITPSSTSSKILVYVSQRVYADAGNTGSDIRIVRGSTTLVTGVNIGYADNYGISYYPAVYLDSPNTTSATTYKTTFNRSQGAGTIFMQPDSNASYICLMEISA
jgi:hypothetical protein